jgi:hypothetical protein
MAEEVVILPALSLALAVKVWEALVKVDVSKLAETLAEEDEAKTVPSINNVVEKIPEFTCPATTGSEADAATVIVPDKV